MVSGPHLHDALTPEDTADDGLGQLVGDGGAIGEAHEVRALLHTAQAEEMSDVTRIVCSVCSVSTRGSALLKIATRSGSQQRMMRHMGLGPTQHIHVYNGVYVYVSMLGLCAYPVTELTEKCALHSPKP